MGSSSFSFSSISEIFAFGKLRGLACKVGSLLSLMKWNFSILAAALLMSLTCSVFLFYNLAIYAHVPAKSPTNSSVAFVIKTSASLETILFSGSSYMILRTPFRGKSINFLR